MERKRPEDRKLGTLTGLAGGGSGWDPGRGPALSPLAAAVRGLLQTAKRDQDGTRSPGKRQPSFSRF
jgi:hypothetical protein